MQLPFGLNIDDIEQDCELGDNPSFLSKQIITYLGNKRSLLPLIKYGIDTVKSELGKEHLTTLDLFSGSGIVARLLKSNSYSIWVNDLESYSETVNKCYLSNRSEIDERELRQAHANLLSSIDRNWRNDGFIADMYSPINDNDIQPGERVFYTRRNAEFIDTACTQIANMPIGIQHFFLAPLIASASVHTNTSGVFKGFYKDKSGIGCFGGAGKNALSRIMGNIEIEYPVFSNHECDTHILKLDAKQAAEEVPHVDIAYLDPPYNQHPYGSNYFMLNLLVDYNRPTNFSAVSGIPTNWNRSPYNKRQKAKSELFSLIENCDASYIMLSYNNEGFIKYDEIVNFLESLGSLRVLETCYNTFRGSRNLHNRDIHVTEYIFLLQKEK